MDIDIKLLSYSNLKPIFYLFILQIHYGKNHRSYLLQLDILVLLLLENIGMMYVLPLDILIKLHTYNLKNSILLLSLN